MKIIGGAIGGLIACGGLLGMEQSKIVGLAFITTGAVIAGIFFLAGIGVAAQGEILRAVLDTAVNTSQLLDQSSRTALVTMTNSTSSDGPSGPAYEGGM